MASKSEKSTLLKNSFNNKVVRGTAIFLAMVSILLLLIFGFKVILLILAGILVASFFLGIASFISSKLPIGMTFSVILSATLFLLLFTGIGFALYPRISEQVDSLKKELPQAAKKAEEQLKNNKVGNWAIVRIKTVAEDYEGGNEQIRGFFSSFFGGLGDIYIIIFLGIFFMAQPRRYVDGMVLLFPKSKRERAEEVFLTMGSTLRKWLLGKLFSMLIVGVLTGIGLVLLGIPMALTLALFAAIISFIPNFGPLIALVPAFLLAFTKSPEYALYTVLLYIGVQAVESNILTPIIQDRMISFPMAMILVAQVVMGIFTGFLGVILAVPVVAIVMVAVKMVYIEDVLDDSSVDVG